MTKILEWRTKHTIVTNNKELLILDAISKKPSYGEEIIGNLLINRHTVNDTLHRLRREGLLETRWALGCKNNQRRKVKLFQITDKGKQQLAELKSNYSIIFREVQK